MDVEQRAELERGILGHLEAGDHGRATEAAIRGYGPEILGFLAAMHREDAEEMFSLFCEGVWRGLPTFERKCSFRTWAYAIARKVSLHYRRDAGRRAARNAPLPTGSALSALSAVEQKVRTETLSFLRTERRTRLVELRDSLPRDDRTLLMLRVDRKLAWNELVEVLHDGAEPLSPEALKREAARLRKRFQLVKEKLYEMARREGLVEG
jgi:RNA polymerase sigma-70 factor (ECF subfamily)